jgi:hypothetical protein
MEMIPKDFYKKSIFYYILVPAVLALWPLSVAIVYLPHTRQAYTKEQKSYKDANEAMFSILSIDPGRSGSSDAKADAGVFAYAVVIGDVARSCGIPTPSISSQPTRMIDNRKTQEATVILQKVEIAAFANFLSSLQKRWSNLECESIILDKQKGLPDDWKSTVKFRYYF